jgi:hypothetical protein
MAAAMLASGGVVLLPPPSPSPVDEESHQQVKDKEQGTPKPQKKDGSGEIITSLNIDIVSSYPHRRHYNIWLLLYHHVMWCHDVF